jgi:hypothetical protein
MGGDNSPENLIELTIEEHAEAHHMLFEKYGKLEDKLAWKALSGKTEEREKLRIELARRGFQNFLKDTSRKKDWQQKISDTSTGRSLSDERKCNISAGLNKAYSEGRKVYVKAPIECLRKNFENNRQAMAEGRRKSKAWNNFHKDPIYREKKRQLMLGRDNYWGHKVSTSKKGKPTKATISVIVNGVDYPSIASAADHLDIPCHRLRSLYRKFGKFITID